MAIMSRNRNSDGANGRRDESGEHHDLARSLNADQSPPINLGVEMGCLGMAMTDPDSMNEIVERTAPDEFFSPAHQKIARVVWDQYGAGLPTDAFSVAEMLIRKGELAEVGGDLYLSSLLESISSAANGAYYASIIHEKWAARQLILAANAISLRSYQNTATADELLAKAESEILAIADSRADSCLGMIGPDMTAAVALIERRKANVAGLATGLTDLDDILDGLKPGQVMIIGARPSMGKTALACNIVDHVAVNLLEPVLLVSLEMGRVEVAERMLASRSRVDGYKLRHPAVLGYPEIQRIGQAETDYRSVPLWIDDSPSRTVLKIAAAARRVKARSGLGLLVIDYLQLIDSDDMRDSRQEQIAKMSRRFKTLARELNVPVLLLSQLNRASEQREDRRPRMSDLRESGAIEQDADVVLLIHRPDYYDPNDQPGVAEVQIAKNRNGATGTVKLTFLRSITRFESRAQVADPIGVAF
jgi:replicative DNA helicase